VESGHFIPLKEKLKKVARALDVPFKVIEGREEYKKNEKKKIVDSSRTFKM
jgi:formyltetrahydrofolate hydrolase